MLEGLSAIDWDGLTHAYGPAGGIPERIRLLASPDPGQWVPALSELYDALCHQMCSVYPATAPAIPFMIELLGSTEVRCRGRILQFLADSAAVGPDPDEDDDGDAEEEAEALEWARQTRAAVWRGLDVALDLLTDLDPRIRVIVPYLLGTLAGMASSENPEDLPQVDPIATIADRMQRHFEEEPSVLVRASLVFGLGCLMPLRREIAPLLEGRLSDGFEGEPVKLAAALCLADASVRPSLATLQVLRNALSDPDRTNRLFAPDRPGMEDRHHPIGRAVLEVQGLLDGGPYPDADVGRDEDLKFPWTGRWSSGWSTSRILALLERAEIEDPDLFVPDLLPYLDRANPHTADSTVIPILRLVFKGRKLTPETCRDDLTAAQARVLSRLYQNLSLWATDIHHGTIDAVGLADRAEWARLLGIEERAPSDAEIAAILDRIAPRQQFGSRPEIKCLCLRRIGTAAFLPHLARFPELEELDLSGIGLSDADLVHLTRLPKLKDLHLNANPITDEATRTMATIGSLESLDLSGTGITDEGLGPLRAAGNLKHIELYHTAVSREAVRTFREARPDCEVWPSRLWLS